MGEWNLLFLTLVFNTCWWGEVSGHLAEGLHRHSSLWGVGVGAEGERGVWGVWGDCMHNTLPQK